MKQVQEQVGENLYELAIELNAQIDEVQRLLGAVASLGATSTPGSFFGTHRGAKDAFTAEICKHEGFIWLFRQSEFKDAFEYFEKRIEKPRVSEWQIALLKLYFLKAFAGSGWQAFSESSWLPRKISKTEKDRALAIATELLTFVRDGLGRPDDLICTPSAPMGQI